MTQVKYSGAFPSMIVQKTTQQAIQDALSWGKVIADNNTFHYGEYGNKVYVDPNSKYYEGGKYRKIHDITHSSGCHFCDTNKAKKVNKANALGYNGANWERTYVCNTFVTAMYAHGAMDKTCYKYCANGSCVGMNEHGRSSRLDNSSEYKYMGKLAIKDLKAGDILVSAPHMQCVYAPVSSARVKIIEATSYIGKFGNDASKKSIRIIEKKPSYTSVYRFVGTVDKTISINMGEISNRVKLMQKFLNWYGDYKLTEDGIFFEGTLVAVKDFQKKMGLTVDGKFGNNSLAKAKECTKEVAPPQPTKKPYSGTFPKLPARRYFKRGDKGMQVKYLQQFLNWYGKYGLVVDGVIGSKTIVAVEKFQKSEGLDVDGLFGKKCLAKAKQAKR